MTRPIFRKTALNRLASPDQLDQLMQVTSLRGWVALAGFALLLFAALLWSWLGTISTSVDGKGILLRGNGVHSLAAPVEGVTGEFLTRSGEDVMKGQPLVRLIASEPGKTSLDVVSPFAGRMLNRVATTGQRVKKGASLLMLESLEEPLLARLYIPVTEGYQIEQDMDVHVWPTNVRKDEFGYVKGRVVAAGRFPISRPELAERLANEDLAGELTSGGPKLQILVELLTDPSTKSGYQWSTTEGPPLQLYSGTPCQARIIVARHRPIHLVFPTVGE